MGGWPDDSGVSDGRRPTGVRPRCSEVEQYMKTSVQRIADALEQLGIQAEITEFAESTRTAEEAAAAVNSTLGQIVKSLVFLAGEQPVLALVSGTNRVDTEKLAAVT